MMGFLLSSLINSKNLNKQEKNSISPNVLPTACPITGGTHFQFDFFDEVQFIYKFVDNYFKINRQIINGTMFKRYYKWYNNLTPLKQLTVSFSFNWFIWFIAWLLGDKIFFDEQHSWGYHIFHATWMAFFWTIFSNWTTIKALFKSNNGNNATKRAHN
jgi:hypothetical protein